MKWDQKYVRIAASRGYPQGWVKYDEQYRLRKALSPSSSWDVVVHFQSTVCHGMDAITFCTSVRISTVFSEFTLKTSVDISTN
jgi:hypothetical protein